MLQALVLRRRRRAHQSVGVALFDLGEQAGQALARNLGAAFCPAAVARREQADAALRRRQRRWAIVDGAGTGNAIKTSSRGKVSGEVKAFPRAQFDRVVQLNLAGTLRCIAKSAAG